MVCVMEVDDAFVWCIWWKTSFKYGCGTVRSIVFNCEIVKLWIIVFCVTGSLKYILNIKYLVRNHFFFCFYMPWCKVVSDCKACCSIYTLKILWKDLQTGKVVANICSSFLSSEYCHWRNTVMLWQNLWQLLLMNLWYLWLTNCTAHWSFFFYWCWSKMPILPLTQQEVKTQFFHLNTACQSLAVLITL